jgi:hypothetical protein
MKQIFIFLMISGLGVICAQNSSSKYQSFVDQANYEYRFENYLKAANLYASAFEINSDTHYTNDYYNAARAWAKAENHERSFYCLNEVYSHKFNNNGLSIKFPEDIVFYERDSIENDKAFVMLYHDSKWKDILDLAERRDKEIDQDLKSELEEIFYIELANSFRAHSLKNEQFNDPSELSRVEEEVKQIDLSNVEKVTQFIDKHGWLGAEVVGEKGNITLTRVILKADVKIQQKYLPIMRDAVMNGNAEKVDLTFLERSIERKLGE